MTQEGGLTKIGSLGKRGIEFLMAAGVEDLVSLARSDASVLHQEMEGANAILVIDDAVPSVSEIERWIELAGEIVGVDGLVKGSGGYGHKSIGTLKEKKDRLHAQIPEAIPVHPGILIERQIVVQDVASMEIFLEDDLDPGSVESEREDRKPEVRKKPNVHGEAAPPVKMGNGKNPGSLAIKPLEKNPIRDIRKTASPGLNDGKKMHSRGYIRGVLHPQPVRVRFAALITIITMLLLPATFVAGGLMLARYTLWLAVIPGAFLLFGILYLVYARGLKCRICGQPLFSPKACHRHSKAHRIPILGYILPTSVHILFFHWFRCSYCGTSIRIKE